MAKRGEEFEIDFADDEISSAGEDDGAEGPTKKRKRSGGRQKLTQERIVSTAFPFTYILFNIILIMYLYLHSIFLLSIDWMGLDSSGSLPIPTPSHGRNGSRT